MLSVFRKSPKLVVIIFALVALAFIATGVITREMPGTGSSSGDGSDRSRPSAARAIGTAEMEQRIRTQYGQAAQQQPGLDMASFVAQAFAPIVEQTIGATALEAFGRSLGLVASKKQVDGSDRRDPRLPAAPTASSASRPISPRSRSSISATRRSAPISAAIWSDGWSISPSPAR